MNNIIIIGGDKRQAKLKELFIQRGFRCDLIGSSDEMSQLENISEYDTVILPVPVSKDDKYIYSSDSSMLLEISTVLDSLTKNQVVFAPYADRIIFQAFSEKSINCCDFSEYEDFIIQNCFLTAQAALRLLLENTEDVIKSKKVLITGYGRISVFLSQILKNNGMDVYVAARKKLQRIKAECCGYKVIDVNGAKTLLYLFDYIFNTVPYNIFSKEDISHFSGKYFELASSPYGTQREYFSSSGAVFVDGSALPGKFLPSASAEIIADFIEEYMRIGGD